MGSLLFYVGSVALNQRYIVKLWRHVYPTSDETKQLRLKSNFMISCSEIRLFYKPHKTIIHF